MTTPTPTRITGQRAAAPGVTVFGGRDGCWFPVRLRPTHGRRGAYGELLIYRPATLTQDPPQPGQRLALPAALRAACGCGPGRSLAPAQEAAGRP